MSTAKNIYRTFQSSDGRVKLATLSGIGLLSAALVLVLAVLPAGAGDGDQSAAGVQPFELGYGGGSGACFAELPPRLPSGVPAGNEIHINNPTTGLYTAADGTEVFITVYENDTLFNFDFTDSTIAAFDVVVNGGSKNTHFDYDNTYPGDPERLEDGPQNSDEQLHAPTKGGSDNLYKLSHINICYDVNPIADLSVKKVPVDANGSTPDPFLVVEGQSVTYEIEVSNAPLAGGVTNTTATGVVVTDIIPTGMEFDEAPDVVPGGNIVGTPGTIEIEGVTFDTYTWTGEGLDLDPGTSITLRLRLRVLDDTGGSDLTNRVSVTGAQSDPNAGPDNEADSEPDVTVEATLSGTVFFDANANSAFDSGEPANLDEDPKVGLELTVYEALTEVEVDSTTSDANTGVYSFTLEPGKTYVVCLEKRDEFQQTIPDLDTNPPAVPGEPCNPVEHEPVGYKVTLTENTPGKDFGNLPLITCGEAESLPNNGFFVASEFTIFADNSVPSCGLKGLSFFYYDSNAEAPSDAGDTAAVLLDGAGAAAGRGVFVKAFTLEETMTPLVYAPTAAQLPAAIPPSWCQLDSKVAGVDGEWFDAWLDAGVYPTLDGVDDAFPGLPEVCKVAEVEALAMLPNGTTVVLQTTIVYTRTDDPYFK